MSQPKLRLGILGVAAINDRVVKPFQASHNVEVRGVASRSLEKARQYAAANGIPKTYGRYEDLLADPEIDAVYNPLPNHLHAEWTVRAADAGKHVLCEKPLCPTAAEAAAVVAHCRAKGVRLMDGFMWPHHPRTRKLRQLIDSGAVGPLKRVVSTLTFVLDGMPVSNIRMQPQAGGGGLLDVGCYCVYASRWAMQAEPVSVLAKAEFVNGVDVAMSGELTFSGGRSAGFDCGFTLPLRMWAEFVGETGTVRVPNMWIPNARASHEIIRPSGPFDHSVEVVETPGVDQVTCMVDEFAAAVREKREPVPNPDEAVKTLRVLDALAKSAREGREVAV